MAETDKSGTAVVVAIGLAVVGSHLVIGAATVVAATRWIGWAAIGIAGAIALHVVSFRKLTARRRILAAEPDHPVVGEVEG